MVGDPAILHTHDVDRLETDFTVSWSDAKKGPFVSAVVRFVCCHSVTVGKLPMDLRMKVGECRTNIRVEFSYACLVWSRVRLRRVIGEIVVEEFVEDVKSSFALNFLGVASGNRLRSSATDCCSRNILSTVARIRLSNQRDALRR